MRPLRDPAPILEVLQATSTLTLATTEADGSPRATPVYFAASPLVELFFLSDPAAPHSRNLVERPAVAAAAYPEVSDWREIRGVQIRGVGHVLSEGAAPAAMETYRTRFPFLDQVPQAFEHMAVFSLRPRWVRLVDNRRGWGFSEEWLWE